MTFVVTEACIQCKYTDCVAVCPVDCFHEGPNFLVINPDGCVDCGICVPECPANAIFADVDLPADQSHFLQLNAELARHPAWTVINVQKDPLPDHATWLEVKPKLDQLDRHGA
ncbi:MAG: ferredoxin family protein [Aquabacterium sp.]|uniref:ferredoxin FdxA n=1 Tax=Aquabacterium sp. TaxID=1872578 RepID=UPI0025C15E43|nr:ferredoxin FdxA [Aquabacterium sp.]MBI5927085.1 ferredoxin family protein [Aquabacterium sp.]